MRRPRRTITFDALVREASGEKRRVTIVEGYLNDWNVRIFRSADGGSYFERNPGRLVVCDIGGPHTYVRPDHQVISDE